MTYLYFMKMVEDAQIKAGGQRDGPLVFVKRGKKLCRFTKYSYICSIKKT